MSAWPGWSDREKELLLADAMLGRAFSIMVGEARNLGHVTLKTTAEHYVHLPEDDRGFGALVAEVVSTDDLASLEAKWAAVLWAFQVRATEVHRQIVAGVPSEEYI